MKVLVVDNAGFMRHILQRLLERHDYTVDTAASGRDGLRILEHETNIGAVVCDLLMPDMDGIEFFKRAKLIERFTDRGSIPPPPFILVTALRPDNNTRKADVERLRQATEIGFLDVLLKPVDQNRLIHLLRKIEIDAVGSEDSIPGLRELQNSIQALQDVLNVAEDSANKDALFETLSNLKTQLAGLKNEVAP